MTNAFATFRLSIFGQTGINFVSLFIAKKFLKFSFVFVSSYFRFPFLICFLSNIKQITLKKLARNFDKELSLFIHLIVM